MNVAHLRRVRRLYKTILRLHKGIPDELRVLGNGYAREEFKRHKHCNEKETHVFMEEWSRYALTLAQQLGLKGPNTGSTLGHPLSKEDLDSMTDDQIQQLYDLMLAAHGEEPESVNNKTS